MEAALAHCSGIYHTTLGKRGIRQASHFTDQQFLGRHATCLWNPSGFSLFQGISKTPTRAGQNPALVLPFKKKQVKL